MHPMFIGASLITAVVTGVAADQVEISQAFIELDHLSDYFTKITSNLLA